jgi:hypothetical protein
MFLILNIILFFRQIKKKKKTLKIKMFSATLQTQSFHPRLLIDDHFDEIINQIDIQTESVLVDQSLQEETKNEINDLREQQIEWIKELKELSLNHLPQQFNEDEYRQKWTHVIDDNSLEYKHKIDKIKEELIVYDCVLLKDPNQIICCVLWVTPWFHNQMNLEFLK